MTVPFGVSIGDFITLGDVAYRVILALQQTRGSCADYRNLISSLSSLNRCLQTTSAVFLSHSFNHGAGMDRPDDAVVNGIMHEIACVRKLLEDFLISTRKYTESLLPEQLRRRAKGEWRKITWSLCRTADVCQLQRDLQLHLQAFHLFAFTLCCQSTKSTLDGMVAKNELLQVKILEMFDLVKTISESLPKEIGYTWEGGWTASNRPIRFQDALGRNMILPLIFCSTQEVFHDILKIIFRRLPGQKLVDKKEYDLQDDKGSSFIEKANWETKMTPGALVTMSVLLKLPPSRKRVHSCPRCGESNVQPSNHQGLTMCSYCQLLFRIVDKDKIIELSESPPKPKPIKRRVVQPSMRSPTPTNGHSSKRPTAPRQNSFKEEGIFRRISYIHQTLISRAAKSSSEPINAFNMLPLHEAAVAGDIAAVRAMLKSGHDVNAQDEYYGSVLQAACSAIENECIELVRYLLENERQIDVNLQGGNYCTALQAAAAMGNESVVRLLLEHGADPNIEGGEYGRVLHAAARKANTESVRLLLENGAQIHPRHHHWGDALQTAAATAYSNSAEVLQVLIDYGADVNSEGGFYGTALQAAAAFYGHTDSDDAVRLLLENGADVNALGGQYGSALHVAAYKGKPVLAELLLKHGADVDAQDDQWGTPLQAAVATVYGGGKDVARLLVEHGADINALGGEYGSALHAAAFKGKESLVSYLLDNGASVHVEADNGSTALHNAARNGHFGVVRLLTEQ